MPVRVPDRPPPELAQDVSVEPDTVHAETVLPPWLTTQAMDPKMAMATGLVNPVPPELAQDVSVEPDTVHVETEADPLLATNAVEFTMTIP
jgi:hypothetical protein